MRVVIVGGGRTEDEILKDQCLYEGAKNAYVIAADAGTAPLLQNNIIPDYVVGDFDSISDKSQIDRLEGMGTEVRRLNPVKDDTDMEAALTRAYELLEKDQGDAGLEFQITILGATGTRLDHVLGNMSLLKQAYDRSYRACLIDANNRIRLMGPGDRLDIKRSSQYGKYISVIPFYESINISMQGFFYPLDHFDMTHDNTLGISNQLTEDGSISLHRGYALVVESLD